MNYRTRFYALTGVIRTVREEYFATEAEALDALTRHAIANGFSRVKTHNDDDEWSTRVSATTPGGRAGRNIGSIEYAGDSLL